MRELGVQTLNDAAREHRAVGAFSTYITEQTQAICRAAEDAGQPVILQAGASAFSHTRLVELAPQALLAADLARVPVRVHLDHSRDLAQVRAALDAGYTSVMMDGSHRCPRQDPRAQRPRPALTVHHGPIHPRSPPHDPRTTPQPPVETL